MSEWKISIIIAILVIIIIISSPFILYITVDSFNLWWNSIIGVEKENVKHEIFKNNKSHVEGMIQDLLKYKLEYDMSDNIENKKALEFTIRHRFANFDENKIDSLELRDFLKHIKYGGK